MLGSVEIEPQECLELLRSHVVGRVAVSTPSGPRIAASTYLVENDTLVVRASPFSDVGTYGRDTMLSLEVGSFDTAQIGWSVVVVGRGRVVMDTGELDRLHRVWPPSRWPNGARHLFIRLPLTEVVGQRVPVTVAA